MDVLGLLERDAKGAVIVSQQNEQGDFIDLN